MRTFVFLSTLILLSCSVASAQEPPPAKVVVQEITREVISENRSYIGLLNYDRMSRVSSDVAGLVEKVFWLAPPLVFLSWCRTSHR